MDEMNIGLCYNEYGVVFRALIDPEFGTTPYPMLNLSKEELSTLIHELIELFNTYESEENKLQLK